jgi:hypothetical protein
MQPASLPGAGRLDRGPRLRPLLLAAAAVLGTVTPIRAASPTPALNPDVILTADPMLGGVFAPGSWAGVRVHVENSGPNIAGELRLTVPGAAAASTYGIPVELASGARQDHFLYGQVGVFGSRFDVSVISGQLVVATTRVSTDINAEETRRIYLVAEHPETLIGDVRGAIPVGEQASTRVTAIQPEDLPPRAEAWSSIDTLIWHDVASSRLTAEQLAALGTWAALGGDLVIVGGSIGIPAFSAFPVELLPYRPTDVIELPTADLATLLGALPPGAAPLPALSGALERGTLLAGSANAAIAARNPFGQGTVTIVGFDLATSWLAGSTGALGLWARVLSAGSSVDTRLPVDDEFLVSALDQLPAVKLPSGDYLLVLILAYIVALGPLNYLVLKRRDRREWAWVTMPLTIGVFAVLAYAFGAALKGSNVIINELAIVQGAAGTDRGLADVHVGLFSPERGTFDLKVGPAALVSAPNATNQETRERPLDVLLGDPATLRGYGVSFGTMRVFRVLATVPAPRVDADLRLADGELQGSIVNSSALTLSDVAIVYANAVALFGELAPGDSRPVQMEPGLGQFEGEPISTRLFPPGGETDASRSRSIATRRAAIQHLAGGWEQRGWDGFKGEPTGGSAGVFGRNPIILAWVSGGALEIDAGRSIERAGETLFFLPARVAIAGHVVFGTELLDPTLLAVDVSDDFAEGGMFQMSQGTISVAYQPVKFDGALEVASLIVELGIETQPQPSVEAEPLAPLPAAEQPDSESPLGTNPRPGESPEAPRIQLFDRLAGSWIEFEPVHLSRSYAIAEPARYVDEAGSFSVRFVGRDAENFIGFTFGARLEGDIR